MVAVMTEHPGWLDTQHGRERVVTAADGRRWPARVSAGDLQLCPVETAHAGAASSSAPEPSSDRFRFAPTDVARSPAPELAHELAGLGTVVRLRNGDLWDAIAVAILRQVIRAAQSKRPYRAFCAAYGDRVRVGRDDVRSLIPTPETVLALDDDAFKRRPLRAAAAAYLHHGEAWRALPAADLVAALQSVPRIGPWTAGAAVADWSNDYALYPYGDLAVRTWAARAAPRHDWPDDEVAFSEQWRRIAADRVSSLTLLILAWGSQRGDIG